MKRTFERTHPWIRFDLDLGRLQPRSWMLLGEAASKAVHLAGVPLAPEVAQRFHLLFLAKGAQATTAIEGNTLTEEQVEAQIDGKLKLPPSQKYLQVEVQNILDAFHRIMEDLRKFGPRLITVQFCKDLNREVLDGLELDEGVVAGEVRRHNVTVGRVYKGAPPEDCHFLLEQMCEHLNAPKPDNVSLEAGAILNALFAHIYLALIHPFGDGNGRTARLLEFYILSQAGFPSPAAHLLSNHYNQTRSQYYTELDRISKGGGACSSFIDYALQGLVDGLKAQIERIKDLQLEVAWENYVHEQFRGSKSLSDTRRRELVLQLGKRSEPVRIADVAELSGRLAREFSLKTDKTLSRDINELVRMNLITKVPGRRVRAKKEFIKAFLPWRVETVGVQTRPR